MEPSIVICRLNQPVGPADHAQGTMDAATTLVQYGNYAHPRCGQAYRVVTAIRRQLGDEVRFVFRHFPLDAIYPFAQYSAEVVEAAGEQDRFWEMHTFLFEQSLPLDTRRLAEYAAGLGLNMARFERELAEHVHLERVRADMRSGLQSGVNGTPTFFINGERYDAAWDLESLLIALQQAVPPS